MYDYYVAVFRGHFSWTPFRDMNVKARSLREAACILANQSADQHEALVQVHSSEGRATFHSPSMEYRVVCFGEVESKVEIETGPGTGVFVPFVGVKP